jgi:hypothetical protein
MDEKLNDLPAIIDKKVLSNIKFRDQNKENVHKRIAKYQEKPKRKYLKRYLMNGIGVIICSCFISVMFYITLIPNNSFGLFNNQRQTQKADVNLAILTRAAEITKREYGINVYSRFTYSYDSDSLNVTIFVPKDFNDQHSIDIGNYYMDKVYGITASLNNLPKKTISEELTTKYNYTINIAKSVDNIFPDLPSDYIMIGTKGKESNNIIWEVK